MLDLRFTATALGLAGAVVAGPASAHITIAEPAARGGSYHAAFFRLSHGCGTSPTVAVRVEIPAGVVMARPQPKPGWTLGVETAPLDRPIRSDGAETLRRTVAVTWRGRLEADQFDQFGLMVRLPEVAGPVYFPTIQTCESGENRWVDIPAPGAAWTSVPHQAPVITLSTAPPAMAGHDH